MGISHLKNKRLKNVKESAVSDHLLTCDCNINFDDFTILSKNSNNINLLIKESFAISRNKPILKKTVKSFPLELFEWQNLIIVYRFDCLFDKNVCDILNVTVMTASMKQGESSTKKYKWICRNFVVIVFF